jgi:SAM-dependent methyltransferase
VLVAGTADVPWFLEFGREMFGLIADCSARHAVPVDRLGAVLEFGCGSGRVLRHWHGVHGPAIHGTDYNRRLAAWCRSALPFAAIGDNDAAPPLPYADATFDLIYAISVFTHLKAAMQRPWLDELHRVLAPGGLAIVTTHGPNFVHQLDAAERAAFDRGELVVHYEETSGLNVCNAYHPEAYVTHDLAQAFDVLERIPAGTRPLVGQDVYVLRARAIRAA